MFLSVVALSFKTVLNPSNSAFMSKSATEADVPEVSKMVYNIYI